jgi:beta-lactamase class A
MTLHRKIAAALLAVVLLASCADSTTNPSTNPSTTATLAPSESSDVSTTSVADTANEATSTTAATTSSSLADLDVSLLPDTPAGEQLVWALTAAADAPDDELEARFAPSFLASVPVPQLREGITSIGISSIDEVVSSTPTELAVLVTSAQGSLLVTINVEPTSPHLITGLRADPGELPEAPSTWEGVKQLLEDAGDVTSFLAAEVAADGSVDPIEQFGAADAVPLGSGFKIYVLGALVQAVADGDIAWTDELTITAELKSLPSGELQDRPDGSTVTVQEAAEHMIQISDNTATDMLIDRLGRERVEAMLPVMGMGNDSQSRTLPFMTTRELFTLKWGSPSGALDEYVTADRTRREQLLDALPGQLPGAADFDATRPIAIDTVEWFATADEITAAHVWLDEFRDRPGFEPLAGILGDNPGVPLDPQTWEAVAFKGGSEPGVVFLGWLLHRSDGRRFVVVASATSSSSPVDELKAASAAQGIIGLLATVP